jgi:hypothetical protein
MHHTKDKGDIALMKTTLDLTLKGYNIFLPISEHLPFDFIAYKDGKCFRIQAKYSSAGKVNNTTYSGDKTKNYYNEDDFDYYAVYLSEIDTCIYPSIKYGGAHFRYTKCNSATPFYWYEDFLEFTDDASKKNYRDMSWTIDVLINENILNRTVKRRKVERPSLEEIIKLVDEKGYSETGRMFGVSDNAVRKWIKFGKQYESKDLER